MTTIAYCDGIIAYDSRATSGGLITNNATNKLTKRNGVIFVMTGAISDQEEIIKAYFGEDYRKQNIDAGAIVDDKGRIYDAAICKDDGFWKVEVTGQSCARGSGERHAWTAMDLGCSAKEAVQMAAKRDVYTGGRIRTHKVRKL